MSLIIVLRNTTALAPVSDYDYEVLVGDGTPERSRTIATGHLTGHVRAHGWQALVAQLLRIELAKVLREGEKDVPESV